MINVVNLLLNRTFFPLNLYLFLYAYCEIISVHSFQDALYFDAISIKHLYLLTNEVDILLWNLEWLTKTSRTNFQFIIFLITTQVFLNISTEGNTILNPHTISMVYLYHDSIVRTDFNANQEIFLILEPFFN